MSRNIYDIFNERKSGVDCLVEGYDAIEQFDSLEEAAYAMEEIIQECKNDCIEFQAASYLEDLVLENMMYDSFDEENMRCLITESLKDRASGIIERLQKAWTAIKEWFKSVQATIAKTLRLSDEWVLDNEDKIREGLAGCNVKVKYPMYKDCMAGINGVEKMLDALCRKGDNPNLTESGLMGLIGIKSRDDIPLAVKRQFMKVPEGQVIPISSISADIIIDWASCRKDFKEIVDKVQDMQNKRFEDELRRLQNKGAGTKDNVASYENFTFVTGLMQTIMSNLVTVVKKGCKDHFQIAKRAVGVRASVGNKIGGAIADKVISKANESFEVDFNDEDIIEEGLLNKFRKLSAEELEEKIEQLQAAVADIEEGNGPKKFLKKAKSELKEAQKALANKQKKGEKAEAKAAKKAAKNGSAEIPAAESFIADFDDIEFEEDFE